jgi:hypothetical protein
MTVNRGNLRWVVLTGLLLLGALLSVPASRADDDRRKDGKRGRERREHEESKGNRERWVFALKHSVEPVSNATYQKECGACHLAYQPALLPARSWALLFANLERHFGHDASLPGPARQELAAYAARNAADTSRGEAAYKILRSLGSATPERITDVPYIRRKHEELPAGVLQRKSIGSLANCAACHRSAEKGLYDDGDVVLPR